MSDPAAPAGEAPPPAGGETPKPPAPPVRPARWLDRLGVLVVCAGLAGATAAAMPPILRAAGVGAPADPVPMVEPPGPRAVMKPAPVPTSNVPPRGTGYAFDDHPRFAP